MKITKKWMQRVDACEPAYIMFLKKGLTDSDEILDWCIKSGRGDWASWMLTRMFKTKKQRVRYSIFAAELVIEACEKEYPTDKKPRLAIETAKNYLKNPCKKTKSAAAAAYVRSASAAARSAARSTAYSAREDAYIKIITYGRSLL